MRSRTLLVVTITAAAALVGLGTVSLAETVPQLADVMPRLAKAYTFPKTEKSPGKVTFNHDSHVSAKDADCTKCHPRLFKILEPGATADGAPLRHDTMKVKRQCGACHDGKAAFGLDKDCDNCHSSGK
jgi:c(7)-type cytochrome triheme protein